MRIALIIADERDGHREYEKPKPYFGPDVTARLEGFQNREDLDIHIISCVRDDRLSGCRLSDNTQYHPVIVSSGYWRGGGFEHIRKVREVVKRIAPDLVHGFGTEYYMARCAAFSGFLNCISILGNMRAVAVRTHFKPFPQMAMSALLEWIVLRKTNAVFCNSSYTLGKVGNLCKKKWLVYPPVRRRFLSIHRDPSDQPTLLCIGLVVPHKNQLQLIHALDSLTEIRDFQLVFAGSLGSNTAYSEAFLAAVDQRSHCRYMGSLSEEGIEALLRKAHGLIHPSLEDSFANVVVEAMAAGLPVAVSAVAGISERIVDAVNGVIFNSLDPVSIADAAKTLLEPSVAAGLAANAKQTVQQYFLPERISDQHVECYRELLQAAEQGEL
jgi:glycosyltransferase involved in cell wall biosynthesis